MTDFGKATVKNEGARIDCGQAGAVAPPSTLSDLIEGLRESVRDGLYFEIDSRDAAVLLKALTA